jgi:uncharacterized membrane protein YbhN (UPF0104 family)
MITPGNLGVRELAYGGFSGALGVGLGTGVLVTLMIRILSFSLLAAMALGLKWYRRQ